MAINNIVTQKFADTVTFNTNEHLPMLGGNRINKKLSNRLQGGSGTVVGVLVPGFNNVVEGSAVEGYSDTNQVGTSKINVKEVPVTVKQYNISAPYEMLDQTLNLFTFETQVSKPNAIRLASKINTHIFDKTAGGATQSAIGSLNPDGSFTQGFQTLSNATKRVKASRIGSNFSGMLHPNLVGSIIGGSANSANLFSQKGDQLYEGKIGDYSGFEFYESPDAGSVTLAAALTSGLTLNGDLLDQMPITDGFGGDLGYWLLPVTAAGAAVGVTLPAGTPLTIGTSKSSDAFGNPNGVRTYTVAESITLASGANSIKIGGRLALSTFVNNARVAGSSNWPIPNTYVTSVNGSGLPVIPNGAAIVCPLAAGIEYARGIAMADGALAFAGITPAPFPGTNDSVTASLDGLLPVRSSFFSNLESGVIRWRFDVLYGVNSLYGNGASNIYIPIV